MLAIIAAAARKGLGALGVLPRRGRQHGELRSGEVVRGGETAAGEAAVFEAGVLLPVGLG